MKKEWLEIIEKQFDKHANEITYSLNDKETLNMIISSVKNNDLNYDEQELLITLLESLKNIIY